MESVCSGLPIRGSEGPKDLTHSILSVSFGSVVLRAKGRIDIAVGGVDLKSCLFSRDEEESKKTLGGNEFLTFVHDALRSFVELFTQEC